MNKMEFNREGHLNDEDILYRTAEVGEWPLNGHCSVIHSHHHHHSRHLRIVSSSSENNVSTSTALRERFQQTRISGSDGHLKIAHNNHGVGPGWPTSNLDPGHEFKASGLLSQMHHKWSSNIGNLGSKLFDLSSNIFSRDHENQYVPRQNIGNDDFEIIERQELVRLRLLTNNGHSNVDATTVRHGHRFVPANLKRSNWCDKCGGFIWGISKYCYICISGYYFMLVYYTKSLSE